MDLERRGLNERVTLRSADDPTIAGYAALYRTETVIADFFREQIAPGAFASALDGTDDVRALFNHDPNQILGRTKSGTLVLSETAKGLRYTVSLNPDDPQAMSVRAKIQRGDVSGSSFGFRVVKEQWEEAKTARDLPLRTILAAELFDVSPVTYPAYPQTSVTARMVQEVTAAEIAKAVTRQQIAVRDRLRARVAIARAWDR